MFTDFYIVNSAHIVRSLIRGLLGWEGGRGDRFWNIYIYIYIYIYLCTSVSIVYIFLCKIKITYFLGNFILLCVFIYRHI